MARYCKWCGSKMGLGHLISRCPGPKAISAEFCEDCGTRMSRTGLWHYSECPKCVPAPWNRKKRTPELHKSAGDV